MSRSAEAGETLVEILLSITIMGIAVTALLLGMGTAATTSGLHTRQAQQAEIVRNFIEAVQATDYVDCAGSYSPVTAGILPAGYSASASVKTWASGAGFASPCAAPDQGAQVIEVKVSQTDNRISEEVVTVIKRKPCPTASC